MDKFMFKLPVGDWSDDGHGKCHYFIIESDKEIKDVYASIPSIKKCLNIDIFSIANEYEDNEIKQADIDKMKKIGIDVDELFEQDTYDGIPIYYCDETKSMAKLFIFLLNFVDNSLNLQLVDDKFPMLTSGSIGYGCF